MRSRWQTMIERVRVSFTGRVRFEDELKFTDSSERALNDRELRRRGLR